MSLNGDCLSREDEENIMESSRSLPEINGSKFVSLTEKSKEERPRSEICRKQVTSGTNVSWRRSSKENYLHKSYARTAE